MTIINHGIKQVKTAPNPQVLLIISCSKGKLPNPAPVKNFYTGRTFKQLARLARNQSYDWVVISGKLGLLTPDQIVQPYDQKLQDTDQDIARVRDLTLPKLKKIIPHYEKIILFMGVTYRKIIEPIIDERFIIIHHPKGLFGYNSLLSSCLKLENGKVLSTLSRYDLNHPDPDPQDSQKSEKNLSRWMKK